MKRFFLAAACSALFLAPASAYYVPKNPHFSRVDSSRGKKKKRPSENILAPGRWNPLALQAIDALIAARGSSSPAYDARNPPIAVLSWEGVASSSDAGQTVFLRMVKDAAFKTGGDFWDGVPLAYGRQEIRAAYEQFSILPRGVWQDEPAYQRFKRDFIASYRNQCAEENWSVCRAFLTSLFSGFSPDEARNYAAAVIQEHMPPPAPEMQNLIAVLKKAGFDVWVIDEDPQPVLEAAASPLGVSASRIIGIKTRVVKGVLTGEILGDIPAREAKTAAILSALGRAPALVVGASSDDADLMSYGGGVRVLVDHGDRTLDALARRKGWILQKPFAP